jgi:hypothetical protein
MVALQGLLGMEREDHCLWHLNVAADIIYRDFPLTNLQYNATNVDSLSRLQGKEILRSGLKISNFEILPAVEYVS